MSPAVSLTATSFGKLVDDTGREVAVQKFTWQTVAGLRLSVLNLDAAIIELSVPDRSWESIANVLLGVNNLDQYLQLDPALVSCAQFEHGWPILTGNGPREDETNRSNQKADFHRIWHPFVDETRLHLSLVRKSPTQNRNTLATVTISVEPSNVVRIRYRTCCTVGGLFRLAHRFLFNLGGCESGAQGTFEHVVQLNADSYVDEGRNIRSAMENVTDLRIAQHLGLALYRAGNEGIDGAARLRGIYQLNSASEEGYALRLIHTGSGRALEMYCDFPWLHFSTLDELPPGKCTIVPFYPREGLKRVSLIFDLDQFVLSVVDGIEPEVPETDDQDKPSGQDESAPEPTARSDTFLKNDGILIHPLACPFVMKGRRKQEDSPHARCPLQFIGHVTLKFGICKALSPEDTTGPKLTGSK
ncbi:uncharacterized protein LOC128723743 [Anopheles nili]|uniref:uncharacterized protein LOC128723743 n=1 Tax=Anopheles nili TaxID=185578 RepID=UPI00237B2F81|nr:uncharacterized protein LOC128723743 [Anopheles nili]